MGNASDDEGVFVVGGLGRERSASCEGALGIVKRLRRRRGRYAGGAREQSRRPAIARRVAAKRWMAAVDDQLKTFVLLGGLATFVLRTGGAGEWGN